MPLNKETNPKVKNLKSSEYVIKINPKFRLIDSHTHRNVCIYIYVCVYVCVYICVCDVCVYMYICVGVFICVCDVCLYIYIYIYIYIYNVCVNVCIYIYVWVYIYIYIHTHAHALIMVLIRTESTRYTLNDSFGETINKFQDCNIKNNIKTLEIKNIKTSK